MSDPVRTHGTRRRRRGFRRPWALPASLPAAVAIAAAVLAASSPPSAAAPKPQPRTHDGLFARLSAGAAFQSLLAPDRGTELRARGAAVVLSGAFGFEVERDLVLHATASMWTMLGPNFTADGVASSGGDGGASALTIGPGLTYFVMPWNAWASLSVGLGVMVMDTPAGLGPRYPEARSFQSRLGWVVDLSAGYELWVDAERAAGAALFVLLSAFPEPNVESLPRWGGPAFGVRATATWD